MIARDDAIAWALSEFGDADLGHKARAKRAVQVGASLMQSPTSSIPRACGDWATTKATYRFLSNRAVDHDELLSGHVGRTAERCRRHNVVIVVQDTTCLSFFGEREGLGLIADEWQGRGLFLHTALAISHHTHEVLGVLNQHAWARPAERRPTQSSKARRKERRESERWAECQRRVARAVEAGAASPKVIAVFDREGDIFEAMEELDRCGHSFVIRASRNRLLADDGPGEPRYLFDTVDNAPVLAHKTVAIPARAPRATRPARAGHPARTAVLAIRAMQTVLSPPSDRRRQGDPLPVNVVLAEELEPPEGVEPLSWKLLTREPIESAEAVLEVIRCYEARWLIEELHMALKTGCASEERQLRTAHALKNFLAIATVIAWQLLALRDAARRPEPILASTILSPLRLSVLNVLKPRTVHPDSLARDALRAIAKLGGFIGRKGDGEPGWRTLWRGFEKLLVAELGYVGGLQRSG